MRITTNRFQLLHRMRRRHRVYHSFHLTKMLSRRLLHLRRVIAQEHSKKKGKCHRKEHIPQTETGGVGDWDDGNNLRFTTE